MFAIVRASCLAALCSTSVVQAAETTSDARQLSKIAVQADELSERTEDTGSYTAESSTTAFKMPLSLRETPQTVTVVSAQAMEDFNLDNARDILTFVPGVHVQSERNSQAWYVEARGYEMQIQYDGIPNPVGVGGRGYGTTDAAFLDRVDVLHGASGLLTGAGNPGGTINLVRKTPGAEFASSLEAGVDSFGGYRLVGDVGGPLTDGGIGGRLVGVHEKVDLYMDDASGKNSAVYGNLELPFGNSTRVWIGGEYSRLHDANYGAHYGFPTQPDGTLYDWSSRKLNLGANWSWEKQARDNIFVRADHLFDNGWRVAGMVQRDRTDFSALEANPGSEGQPVVLIGTQLERWGNRTYALDLFVEGPFQLFEREHRLVVGVNGASRKLLNGVYEYTGEALTVIADPGNWRTSMAPDPSSIEWFASDPSTERQEQVGVYAAGRFALSDSLHALLGTRITWIEFDGVWTNTKESGEITPYTGVVWDFSRTMSAYASYSEIFNPHNVDVIGGNGSTLSPVVGENMEVGLKLELADGAFNAALAVFQLDQTNLAEPDFVAELPPICGATPPLDYCSRASGQVRNRGVELSAAGALGANWQITAGYAYFTQNRDQTSDNGGLSYNPTSPRHKFNLGLAWTSADDRFNAGASVRAQSESYVAGELTWDLDNDGDWTDVIPYRIQQDEYVVVGLFGRWRVTPKVSASVAVDNVFDERYLSGISYPVHGQVWGDARLFTVSVKTTF